MLSKMLNVLEVSYLLILIVFAQLSVIGRGCGWLGSGVCGMVDGIVVVGVGLICGLVFA